MEEYKSYAKINLGLEIVGKREDGFHELRTIFQTISLHDILIAEHYDEEIIVETDRGSIPDGPDNLAYKGVNLLREYFNINNGIKIFIKKRIPDGGGLGGGSGNCAVAMLAASKMWDLDCSIEELSKLGAQIGSDVPFFFTGGTALGTGCGEVIEPLDDLENCHIILAFPKIGISTALAYKNLSKLLTRNSITNNITSFVRGKRLISSLTNDFEKYLFPKYPFFEDITKKFLKLGAGKAGVSGSGSTLFGVFDDSSEPENILEEMTRGFPEIGFEISIPISGNTYRRMFFVS